MSLRPLGLSLLLAVLTGCGNCGGSRARDAGAAPAAPPTAPASLAAEMAIDDVGALLTALRSQTSPEVARMVLPESTLAFIGMLGTIPESLHPHIPANARVRSVFLRAEDGTKGVLAVRITRNADPVHPLGPNVALVDGAPHGAKWVMGAPAENAPALALLGDVLLVGDDRETLELAAPYAAKNLLLEDFGDGAHMRLVSGTLGGPLRAMLDQQISAQAETAIAAARAERARHTEAPTLGEPEQAVVLARDNARRMLAYLPDAGEVTGRLRVLPHGVDLDIRLAVAPGTPLAREVSALRVGAPFGLAALPRSIAFARSVQSGGSDRVVDSLVRFAGNRITDADRVKLEAAETALDGAMGPASILGIGGSREGAYVLYGAPARAATLDTEALRGALSLPFVGGALGSIVGCTSVAPAAIREGAPASLCRRTEPPFPQVELTRGEGAVALALTTVHASGTAHPAPLALVRNLAQPGAGTLGESPDVMRALGALGDHVVTSIVIVPTNLMPSLGLFDVPVLRRLAAAPPGDETLAPTLVALTREQDGVHFRLIVTPHGADQIFQVGFLFSQLAMMP